MASAFIFYYFFVAILESYNSSNKKISNFLPYNFPLYVKRSHWFVCIHKLEEFLVPVPAIDIDCFSLYVVWYHHAQMNECIYLWVRACVFVRWWRVGEWLVSCLFCWSRVNNSFSSLSFQSNKPQSNCSNWLHWMWWCAQCKFVNKKEAAFD